MQPEQIVKLLRDENGNFSYTSPAGLEVNVPSESENHGLFEDAWKVLGEMREAELKKHQTDKTESLWKKLRGLAEKMVPKIFRAGIGRVGSAVAKPQHVVSSSQLEQGKSFEPTSSHETDIPLSGGISQENLTTQTQKAAFVVQSLRRLENGSIHVEFDSGVEVTVDPTSSYAVPLSKLLDLDKNIHRSLAEAAENKEAPLPHETAPIEPREAAFEEQHNPERALEMGMVREISQGMNGKRRFVFLTDGKEEPLRVSEQEAEVLGQVLSSGHRVEFSARTKTNTVKFLEGIKYEVNEAKVEENFRKFVQTFDASRLPPPTAENDPPTARGIPPEKDISLAQPIEVPPDLLESAHDTVLVNTEEPVSPKQLEPLQVDHVSVPEISIAD